MEIGPDRGKIEGRSRLLRGRELLERHLAHAQEAALLVARTAPHVRRQPVPFRPATGEQREGADARHVACHVRAHRRREGPAQLPLAQRCCGAALAALAAIDAHVKEEGDRRARVLPRQRPALDPRRPRARRLRRLRLDEARLQLDAVLPIDDRLRGVGLAIVLGEAVLLDLALLARVPQLEPIVRERAPHEAGHHGRRVGAGAQPKVHARTVGAPKQRGVVLSREARQLARPEVGHRTRR